MGGKLYYNTVKPQLASMLRKLMDVPALSEFRLVEGTCLSLLLGHRMSVDIDLFTDAFINLPDHIRMAAIEDIAAMKIDVISRGGRKKDFWDIHELANQFTIQDMLGFHQERYPYSHETESVLKNMINFNAADDDFDPICLRGKYWELIKLDIVEMVSQQSGHFLH